MTVDRPTPLQQLRHVIGRPVDFDLRPFHDPVIEIAAMEPVVEALDDEGIRARAAEIRASIESGGSLDESLAEVFALVREAARRRLGQRPYDEQIMAGIALHEGRVAEMQTGEGKTLAAVAPATLRAMTGFGVHIHTVNDYLARRDAGWMGPIYELLGVSVGCVQEGMSVEERRKAYDCDLSYVTAKEAGFDLLRDGLCLDPGDRVHRPFQFVIVDEADSILIDEARVPLVIAGAVGDEAVGLGRLAKLACELKPEIDYDTDEYSRNINLTEVGSQRVERELQIENLYAEENIGLMAAVRNAMHAEMLLDRDVDYIVRDGRVEVVDELTGRVVEDRQWPDGLQAAIEAKEGLDLQPEGRILGSITMQHFMLSYPRMAGMTATARPAAEELKEAYGLEVVVIPTHRPCIRVDHPDRIFTHREAKRNAVVDEIFDVHETGRPILVGTASVAESERLAAALRETGLECQVLNAKNDEAEAEVVAEAGAIGAVTISTNMAGRGTDIRLGGRDESDRDAVVALGGLYVIGTNRHESLRIDRQLRGRAGRQGDPGSARFFVSLEDDLLVRFGIEELIPRASLPARQAAPVEGGLLRREIARAQRIVDGQNFEMRKTLKRYSDVLEAQRRFIQDWRREVLEGGEEVGVLAEASPERWENLTEKAGQGILTEVERRITLVSIDRCWCDYLAEMARVRDGIHLVSLGGKTPYEVFHEHAREAFRRTLDHIDAQVVSIFESVTVTEDGVDWEAEDLLGPSSTWTYLVTDMPFTTGPLAAMAGRPSLGILVAWMYWPLWLAWGFYRKWKIRKDHAEGRFGDQRG
jgi:preprotein translocase subunit SecA